MGGKFLSAAQRRELAASRGASGRGGVLPGGSGHRSRSRTVRNEAATAKRRIYALVGLSALGLVVWRSLSRRAERTPPSVVPSGGGGGQEVAAHHGGEHKVGVSCPTFGGGAKKVIKNGQEMAAVVFRFLGKMNL